MTEMYIGKVSDFPDPGRKVYDVEGVEFGVFRLGDEFHAYLNICPHIDGPVCQGKILPRVVEDVKDDKTSDGRVFSKSIINITCPWHGMEFDIRTGQHPYDKRYRLKKLNVRVAQDQLYVEFPAPRAAAS